jgi:Fe-S cluster assembly protein SufD
MSAELKPIKTAAESALAAAFTARKSALPGVGAIAKARDAAFARFERSGLPHRRIEQWKYTDLRALMREARPLAGPPGRAAKTQAKSAAEYLSGVSAYRFVFIDGTFVPELSEQTAIPGVTFTSLAGALARSDGDGKGVLSAGMLGPGEDVAFALNTAFMSDGAVIHIAENATVAKPIHLVFVHSSEATAVFARSRVVIEAGAEVTLVESHEGPKGVGYQVNTALQLVIGDRAKVDHIKIGHEGEESLHIATLAVSLGEHTTFRDFTFTLGGAVSRNQLFITCAGSHATLTIGGVNLLRHAEHGDLSLTLDHKVGGCTSREVFKSVLDGESRGVFQGRIVVRPNAQKTDARMMMRALLLSEEAEADHKPELEIFADDVQCGHGATAGALDQDLKFYLMARGITEPQAEALLIQGFIGDAVETVGHVGVRDALMFATLRWLGERR